MVLVLGLNPLVTPWLAAKILALVLYVGLGSAVMRSSKRRTRMCCFLLANLVYVYIIAVAFSKSPLPGLI